MKIYVVQVTPEATISRVSQEGYKTYNEAKVFIKSRSGSLTQISDYKWRDENYTYYEIFEVRI